MTSAVKLALKFWTQAYSLAWTSRTEHKWKPNVQDSQQPAHIMQTVPQVAKRKEGIWTQQILYSLILFSKWKHQNNNNKKKHTTAAMS